MAPVVKHSPPPGKEEAEPEESLGAGAQAPGIPTVPQPQTEQSREEFFDMKANRLEMDEDENKFLKLIEKTVHYLTHEENLEEASDIINRLDTIEVTFGSRMTEDFFYFIDSTSKFWIIKKNGFHCYVLQKQKVKMKNSSWFHSKVT